MENIIEELRKGNINVLDNLTLSNEYSIFSLLEEVNDKKEILASILPRLKEIRDCYRISSKIFELIYLDEEYKEYVYYLLHYELVKPSILTFEEVKYIIKTNWGFNYVLKNAEAILDGYNIYPRPLIELILEQIGGNQKLFNICLERFLHSEQERLREEFIFYLIEQKLLSDKELVVAALYQNPDEFLYGQECFSFMGKQEPKLFLSHLPCLLSELLKLSRDREYVEYKELLKKYYSTFFYAESKQKIRFVNNLNYIDNEIHQKYWEIFRIAKNPIVQNTLDFILSSVINAEEEGFIMNFIKDEEFNYFDKGSTRKVFKIGNDKILKFARFLHSENNITRHFLLAPTALKVISVNNGRHIYIERQENLSKVYNGIPMTKEDIENFLVEAEKQGLVIEDPLCLNKQTDNFGFLKDYKDATLVGVNSYEELPDWFKKIPIVLYDIDMVSYEKGKQKSL